LYVGDGAGSPNEPTGSGRIIVIDRRIAMTEHVDDAGTPGDLTLVSFCRAHHTPLLRWLTLYVADREVAEELSQEAIEQTVKHWRRVRRMEHPEAWLYRVAVNRARSRWRRLGAHRRALERDVSAASALPDPDDAIVVRDALARLPERQRCALTLRYLLDLPASDVATIMDCSVETVKTHVKRGLAHLRDQQLIGTEEPESEQ
jgi:RNA polymerase sigma-70 factor, ECF subfamily